MQNTRPSARSVLLDHTRDDLPEDIADAREKQFFNQLVLANGTLKTTFARRLTDVDALCNGFLADTDGEHRLLDVAVSSGVTTWEWMQSLDAAGVAFSMDAFDLCVDASIVSLLDNFHVLRDSSGRTLQFEIAGRTVENALGETWQRRFKRILPLTGLRLLDAVLSLRPGAPSRPVKLVTRHLQEPGRVRVFEHDLRDVGSLDGEYAMIRAANILNLAYFDRKFLSEAIGKLKNKLADGGYLCIVRTHSDNSNHCTLFRRDGDRLVKTAAIGNGSEVEALALDN